MSENNPIALFLNIYQRFPSDITQVSEPLAKSLIFLLRNVRNVARKSLIFLALGVSKRLSQVLRKPLIYNDLGCLGCVPLLLRSRGGAPV